jgi:hypothetical protein
MTTVGVHDIDLALLVAGSDEVIRLAARADESHDEGYRFGGESERADDYVVARGEAHTVEEFVVAALRACRSGLAGRMSASTRSSHAGRAMHRRWSATRPKSGNGSGRSPRCASSELVRMMVDPDLGQLSVQPAGAGKVVT